MSEYRSHPSLTDTDGDGLRDGEECYRRCNPITTNNEANAPVTGNPRVADTDDDGFNDYVDPDTLRSNQPPDVRYETAEVVFYEDRFVVRARGENGASDIRRIDVRKYLDYYNPYPASDEWQDAEVRSRDTTGQWYEVSYNYRDDRFLYDKRPAQIEITVERRSGTAVEIEHYIPEGDPQRDGGEQDVTVEIATAGGFATSTTTTTIFEGGAALSTAVSGIAVGGGLVGVGYGSYYASVNTIEGETYRETIDQKRVPTLSEAERTVTPSEELGLTIGEATLYSGQEYVENTEDGSFERGFGLEHSTVTATTIESVLTNENARVVRDGRYTHVTAPADGEVVRVTLLAATGGIIRAQELGGTGRCDNIDDQERRENCKALIEGAVYGQTGMPNGTLSDQTQYADHPGYLVGWISGSSVPGADVPADIRDLTENLIQGRPGDASLDAVGLAPFLVSDTPKAIEAARKWTGEFGKRAKVHRIFQNSRFAGSLDGRSLDLYYRGVLRTEVPDENAKVIVETYDYETIQTLNDAGVLSRFDDQLSSFDDPATAASRLRKLDSETLLAATRADGIEEASTLIRNTERGDELLNGFSRAATEDFLQISTGQDDALRETITKSVYQAERFPGMSATVAEDFAQSTRLLEESSAVPAEDLRSIINEAIVRNQDALSRSRIPSNIKGGIHETVVHAQRVRQNSYSTYRIGLSGTLSNSDTVTESIRVVYQTADEVPESATIVGTTDSGNVIARVENSADSQFEFDGVPGRVSIVNELKSGNIDKSDTIDKITRITARGDDFVYYVDDQSKLTQPIIETIRQNGGSIRTTDIYE